MNRILLWGKGPYQNGQKFTNCNFNLYFNLNWYLNSISRFKDSPLLSPDIPEAEIHIFSLQLCQPMAENQIGHLFIEL